MKACVLAVDVGGAAGHAFSAGGPPGDAGDVGRSRLGRETPNLQVAGEAGGVKGEVVPAAYTLDRVFPL